MVVRDHSNLRAVSDNVPIPLNGAVYYAEPDPPAEVIIAATAGSLDEETAQRIQESGVNMTDPAAMARLAETDLTLALRLAAMGSTRMERAVRFIQQVLTPESRRPFADAMRPLPDGASPELAEAHRKVAITMPQVMAVYQDLIAHYAGGRPTVPSSPSSPGDDGNGPSSMESVPLTASPPTSYQPPVS